jgi:hypothetical protein
MRFLKGSSTLRHTCKSVLLYLERVLVPLPDISLNTAALCLGAGSESLVANLTTERYRTAEREAKLENRNREMTTCRK